MNLATAEALASIARKQARSWRLGDRLQAHAARERLFRAGWVNLARSIPRV